FSSDPAGRNRYTLLGSYDTITNKPSYGAEYVNSSLPTNIGLGYADSVSYLGASSRTVESRLGHVNITNPSWPFNSNFFYWNLGGQWGDTAGNYQTYRRIGPTAALVYNRMQTPLNTWGGYMAEIGQQQFLADGGNYTAYGRTYVHGALTFPIFGA